MYKVGESASATYAKMRQVSKIVGSATTLKTKNFA